jgi:hypothetical protein
VIRQLRGDTYWHGLIRSFYREHRAHSPLFPELGREFLRYLETRATQDNDDPPFLLELAHYEWVELALAFDEHSVESVPHDREGDLLQGVPVLSPLAWPLAYTWPVQQLRADFQPTEPPEQPTFLLVVRDRADQIQFKGINALVFQLLQALDNNAENHTGRELLTELARALGTPDVEAFINNAAPLLEQLRERDAVLGTRRANPNA